VESCLLSVKALGMKKRVKPIIALASGVLLLPGLLCQSAQAQGTFYESGTSVLADDVDTATGPEALTVSWFVAGNTDNLYTYGFNVNNPTGDVELPGAPDQGAPEMVGSFSLSFDATVPGAFVSGNAPAGGTFANEGTGGLTWTFPAVSPGAVSGLLVFQSDLPPSLTGQASAGGGAIPPSPWSTFPAGTPVPVPRGVPEPVTTDLLALTALMMLPFSSTWRGLLRKSWNSL
jgi:hypothetical protein